MFGLLSSRFDKTEVFTMFLMMSCCDMFDLTILSHWSILLGYFLVAHWESMDIVIYRWCFPIARRELMWLLLLSLWWFFLDLSKPNHGNVFSMLYDELYLLFVIVFQSYCVKLRSMFWDNWLNHLSCWSILLGYVPVARWESMGIVIYILMLSSHLYKTKVILLWFFDLWFHELRVGNLHVMLGSGLQWRPEP